MFRTDLQYKYATANRYVNGQRFIDTNRQLASQKETDTGPNAETKKAADNGPKCTQESTGPWEQLYTGKQSGHKFSIGHGN